MSAEAVTFWICGTLAVIGGIGLISSRKAVHSALWMALTMINLAVLYIANAAPFLGFVQVIVYTGAVMMLFLFVLMVVGVDSSDSLVETIKGQRLAAVLVVLSLAVMAIAGIGAALTGVGDTGLEAANAADGGNVQGLARLLFTDHLIAFEVTSALLITAALGAMVLAHRETWLRKPTQAEISQERFKRDEHPGNLPAPGTFARHNAIGTPALLPDGSVAGASIPGPLKARGQVQEIDEQDIARIKEINQ